jgi:hypothetical protein
LKLLAVDPIVKKAVLLMREFIAMHIDASKTTLAVKMKMVLIILLILMIILVMKRIFVHQSSIGNHRNNFHLRVDLSEFEGRFDPDGFIGWINTTDHVFAYKGIPDEDKVLLAS